MYSTVAPIPRSCFSSRSNSAGRWTAYVVISAHLTQNLDQPFGFSAASGRFGRPQKSGGVNPEGRGERLCETDGKLSKQVRRRVVMRFEQGSILFEKGSFRVCNGQSLPMFGIPISFTIDPYLVYRRLVKLSACGRGHRYCEPLRSMKRLHTVPIPPAVFVILGVIVKHEDVGFLNLMEVASPGNIRWLKNHTGHEMKTK